MKTYKKTEHGMEQHFINFDRGANMIAVLLKVDTGNVRANDVICKGICNASVCNTKIECVPVRKILTIKIENGDANCEDDAMKLRILQ